MIIDATFWVAISFIIFIGILIYLKIPQKINNLMNIRVGHGIDIHQLKKRGEN